VTIAVPRYAKRSETNKPLAKKVKRLTKMLLVKV
jgi:hypothetical protein